MIGRIRALERILKKSCGIKLVVVIEKLNGNSYLEIGSKEIITPGQLSLIGEDPNAKLVVIRPASRWKKSC